MLDGTSVGRTAMEGQMAYIPGTTRSDNLFGTADSDLIDGFEGNDLIYGYRTDGTTTELDLSADRLFGHSGNDVFVGGYGADYIDGGADMDYASYIDSGTGVIVDLAAGRGYSGTAQGDRLVSIESVYGSRFDDVLFGSDEGNILDGAGGNDILLGFDGGDVLYGGGGDDEMHGGRGHDTYYVDSAADIVSEDPDYWGGADGIDTVYSTISFNLSTTTTVIGEVENLTLGGSANINGVGNWTSNFMIGNSGSNVLNGGAGADWLSGMAGRDNYVVDNAGDTVDESMAGSNGIDIVSSYISFNLSNAKAVHGAVEDLVLLGSGGLNATGNGLANHITGNAGSNVIDGLAGIDWLTGGGGNDFFLFDTAPNSSTNFDLVLDFNVAMDTISLENAIFTRLAVGMLAAPAFYIGAAAHAADDRLVYNSATGALFYDADGTGAAAAVRFAILDPGLHLTRADFAVV